MQKQITDSNHSSKLVARIIIAQDHADRALDDYIFELDTLSTGRICLSCCSCCVWCDWWHNEQTAKWGGNNAHSTCQNGAVALVKERPQYIAIQLTSRALPSAHSMSSQIRLLRPPGADLRLFTQTYYNLNLSHGAKPFLRTRQRGVAGAATGLGTGDICISLLPNHRAISERRAMLHKRGSCARFVQAASGMRVPASSHSFNCCCCCCSFSKKVPQTCEDSLLTSSG